MRTYRVHEVEQRPQLLKGVLNGGPTQQQTVLGVQAFELTDQAAVTVLHALAFVDNEVRPLVLLQVAPVDDAHFVGGDEHLKYGLK